MAFLEESENLFTHIPSPPSPLSLGGEWGTITPSPLKGEGWGEGSPSLSFSPSLVRRGLGGGIPQAHALTDYTDRFVTVSGYEL
ncbi:MAG: hypothetical protein H6767_08170 [Candidatus Peribacteria bacterium]|nr:MAG: hypothetical protein H6767_08170 [Candidatus Peribacteria bacterium]